MGGPKPLLDAMEEEPGLTVILFTLDETVHSRTLAPLAGVYPAPACLGYLVGHETIHPTISDPPLAAYARTPCAEVIPSLTPSPGADLAQYAQAFCPTSSTTSCRARP